MKLFLVFSISVLFFSCTRNRRNENNISHIHQELRFFTIKKFVDGDTFWVDDKTQKGKKIRLIGIDTPENQARFGKPEEFFGDEASEYTKRILKNKKVRLEYDKDKYDSFGRTLAYVYLEDGTFLNAKLIEDGYAEVMTVEPNDRYEGIFQKLEKKANSLKIGIWSKQ